MVGGVDGHYHSGAFGCADDRWVLRLEYTSGRDESGPDEHRAFTDFRRTLVGAIEQPVGIE